MNSSLYSTLFLLAALAALVSSTAETNSLLRGSSSQESQAQESQDQEQQQEQRPSNRRRLLEQVTCRYFLTDINYEPDDAHPDGYSDHELMCDFDGQEAERIGIYSAIIELDEAFVDHEDHHHEATHEHHHHHFLNAVSGESILSISRAVVDTESFKMYIPAESFVEVKTERDLQQNNRQLATKTKGDLKTIVIRVIDSKNHQPTSSISDLQDDVFQDAACLKSQFQKCSQNQLRIQEYGGVGVFDLRVDYDLDANNSRASLHNAAKAAFNKQFGSPYDKSKFDLVLFCDPPESAGNSGWGAWGQVNGPISVYSNDRCGNAASQMHEVGHCLNLEHSGKIASDGSKFEYGDVTGNMGASATADDHYRCFNAAKNWQLDWFPDRQRIINPLNSQNPVTRVTLNGVVDYRKSSDGLVGVRLEQTSLAGDYYIGYNRADGANKDTEEGKDMITIIRKDTGPFALDFSWQVAQLAPGGSYTIPNFNNQRNVEIKMVGAANNKRDAIVDIIDFNYKPPDYDQGEPCEKHIIEIKTDKYPGDTSWVLVETGGMGRGFGKSPTYTQAHTVHRTEVCLPYNTNYKFTIFDQWADGICCIQGQGYWKVLDSKNQVKAAGGYPNSNEGPLEEKNFSVGKNPNPSNPTPTQAPTQAPTKAPTNKPINKPPPNNNGDCVDYTIEIATDDFPEDNSWKIKDPSGVVQFAKADFERNHVHQSKVCLKHSTKYEFVMTDEFNDGMCCKHGKGHYKVRDPKGNTIIDSTKEEEAFNSRTKTISVASKDGEQPECKDRKVKFKLKVDNKKARSCKNLAKKGKCDYIQESKNVPVWELCPVSCGKC